MAQTEHYRFAHPNAECLSIWVEAHNEWRIDRFVGKIPMQTPVDSKNRCRFEMKTPRKWFSHKTNVASMWSVRFNTWMHPRRFRGVCVLCGPFLTGYQLELVRLRQHRINSNRKWHISCSTIQPKPFFPVPVPDAAHRIQVQFSINSIHVKWILITVDRWTEIYFARFGNNVAHPVNANAGRFITIDECGHKYSSSD